MILDEVKVHRNLYMMWFDYKKAFDSVPHDWIIKALQLANVPHDIIEIIKSLMSLWSTKLSLNEITTNTIDYLCGILQGDCLSLMIFILSVNPLSFLLKRLPGYIAGPQAWKEKPQHGYLMRTREDLTQKNETASNAWMKRSTFSSHVEGYLCAIQEEEIFTNALKSRRVKDVEVDANCRRCRNSKETIQHVVSACPRLSASMYLPLAALAQWILSLNFCHGS